MREKLMQHCYAGATSRVRATLADAPEMLRSDPHSADFISAALRGADSKILNVLTPEIDRAQVDAVARRIVPLIDLLLRSGADPNGPTRDDLPPLHVAAQLPTLVLLQHLIERGADSLREDALGKRARDVAGYDFVRDYLGTLSED